MASESVEDYLKAIYKLQHAGWAGTGEIAQRLGVSPPSVSRMMRRLSEKRWVKLSPYRGVRLTEAGRAQALRIVRNHRVLETYFAQRLGMSWDRVDEEVERLEHVVSDELINRMEEALGFPTQDPHGSPIPDREGQMPDRERGEPLTETPEGGKVRVQRIVEAPPSALTYLEERGLVPGSRLEVVGQEPFNGPVVVEVQGRRVHLGRELAQRIRVTVAAVDGEPREARR